MTGAGRVVSCEFVSMESFLGLLKFCHTVLVV